MHIVWEFHVRLEKQAEFERIYKSDGDWAKLFRLAPGFISTSLVRDSEHPTRYLCTDDWFDHASFDAFKQTYAADYAALDEKCEALTEEEIFLGCFDEV